MTELIITGLMSIVIFILYILVVLLIMLFISSYLAAVVILLIPILVLVAVPDIGIEFLGFKQVVFLNGTVVINNLHILLFIWSALLSIVVYTELVSWYISREIKGREPLKSREKPAGEEQIARPAKKPGQVNIPFKPLERFLQKFEQMISGKK